LGSCAVSTQMTITVNQIVTPSFTQVSPVCQGTTLANLPLVSNNSISGSWSPAMNNNATTTYTFTPVSGSCANATQMTIVVNQRTNPSFSSVNTQCFGVTNFSLPLISNNGISGTWSPAFNNTATTTYTFTPNSNECANVATLQVPVFEDFNFVYDGYCRNGDFILEVLPNTTFNMNSSTINWHFNNLLVGTNNVLNVSAYLNSTAPVETLPHTFTVTVTDENGCDKTQTIVLTNIYCGIQKGISMNNDGLNDFFDLRLLDVKKLSIFNRYGVKVYSKQNYYDEWRGQTDKGETLPDGTYYYLIDFENEEAKTGWIYLIREK